MRVEHLKRFLLNVLLFAVFFYSNAGVPETKRGRRGGVGTPERGAGDLPEAAVV